MSRSEVGADALCQCNCAMLKVNVPFLQPWGLPSVLEFKCNLTGGSIWRDKDI